MGIIHDSLGQWRDTDNKLQGFKNIDGQPRMVATPYLYQISEGNVANHRQWNKEGYNGDVDTGEEDLWPYGGTFAFSPTAQQMEVISSDGADAAAGTGVQKVIINYLNKNYEERSEIVTMNGATAVATAATDILRINAFRAYSVGTGKVAAGNIDIRETDDSPVYSRIMLGYTRARNSAYTVPVGNTLYITSARFSVSGSANTKVGVFTARYTYDEKNELSLDFYMPFVEIGLMDNGLYLPFEVPIRVPEKVDLKVSFKASVDNCICTSVMRGWREW